MKILNVKVKKMVKKKLFCRLCKKRNDILKEYEVFKRISDVITNNLNSSPKIELFKKWTHKFFTSLEHKCKILLNLNVIPELIGKENELEDMKEFIMII